MLSTRLKGVLLSYDDQFPRELQKLQTNIDVFHDKVKNATGENSLIQHVHDIRSREKEISRTLSLSAIDENIYLGNEKAAAAEQSIVNTDQVLEETDDKLNDAFNNLDTQVRGALKSVQERANNAETQSENMRKTAHEAREIVDKLERGADALTRKADDAKNRSIEAYEIAKKAITKQNNITKKNDCCESSSIM
jgi:laminin gamma 1